MWDSLQSAVCTKDCKTGDIKAGSWNRATKSISQLSSPAQGMRPEVKSALDRQPSAYAGDSRSCCAQALFTVGGHRN